MEELGKAITELLRAGRDIGMTVAVGYFTYRILEVVAWPLMYFGVGLTVVRTIGLKLSDVAVHVVDGWRTRHQAALARAKAEWAQQLLSAELYVERRKKGDAEFKPPAWYTEATTYWPGASHFTTND